MLRQQRVVVCWFPSNGCPTILAGAWQCQYDRLLGEDGRDLKMAF